MFDLVLFCEWMTRTTYEYSSVFRIRIQKNEFFLKTIPFGFPGGASFVHFQKTEIGWTVGMITMKTVENKPFHPRTLVFDFPLQGRQALARLSHVILQVEPAGGLVAEFVEGRVVGIDLDLVLAWFEDHIA